VDGIAEVFHAHFTDHVYPAHTHDAWTLLIVDDGAVRFDLERHEHGALPTLVTLLPPHVPHDGRSATPRGFRKRVLYLDAALLGEGLIGAAVDRPTLVDPLLRQRIHQLHQALTLPGEELEAYSRLAFIQERLQRHLHGGEPARVHSRVPASTWPVSGRGNPAAAGPGRYRLGSGGQRPGPASRLRELLDARMPHGVNLRDASVLLDVHPTHLVRAFAREYGLPPHRYLTGRRVDLARRLLLSGQSPAAVATAAGFYDQAHLTRHFTRMLGTSPARYARSAGRTGAVRP
jgi:AraC-like DNA-binding protein